MSLLAWMLLLTPAAAAPADAAPLYQIRDVVPVADAPQGRVYDAALIWALENFRDQKYELAEDPNAGTVVATSKEKLVTLDSDGSCALWLSYRVTVAARPGRYFYDVSVLELEPDPKCPKTAFRISTTEFLGLKAPSDIILAHIQNPHEAQA
ncbi:MAG TPA: DUF4468 domain-containing protein, partial [Thermoanaerobaculia bacterium]|nr:DUF4468 domain-containing protein [Thermoanaerobaculia bacterium]